MGDNNENQEFLYQCEGGEMFLINEKHLDRFKKDFPKSHRVGGAGGHLSEHLKREIGVEVYNPESGKKPKLSPSPINPTRAPTRAPANSPIKPRSASFQQNTIRSSLQDNSTRVSGSGKTNEIEIGELFSNYLVALKAANDIRAELKTKLKDFSKEFSSPHFLSTQIISLFREVSASQKKGRTHQLQQACFRCGAVGHSASNCPANNNPFGSI